MNTGPEEASRSTPTRSFSCARADLAPRLAAAATTAAVPNPASKSRRVASCIVSPLSSPGIALHFNPFAPQTPGPIRDGPDASEPRAEIRRRLVGGGSAGTAAAVAAARIGARTLLVEAAGFLGGAATLRNVLTYCGLYTLGPKPRSAVGGVAREVVARLTAIGAVTGPKRFRGVFVVFDPEAVKRVLDDVVTEAGVDVLLHALAIGAERDGDAIRSVTVQDRNGPHAVEARAFVDATGDGD